MSTRANIRETLLEGIRPDLSKNSKNAYQRDVAVVSGELSRMGVISTEDLSTGHFALLRDSLALRYSPKTVERVATTARRLAGVVGDEDALKIWQSDPGVPRADQVKPLEPLSSFQAERLVLAARKAPTLRDAVMIKAALVTGAAVSEILGLDRAEVISQVDGVGKLLYKNVRAGQKPRLSLLDQEASEATSDYLSKRDDTHPALLISERRRSSSDWRLTRQGVHIILDGYSDAVGRKVNSDILRETFVFNFEGYTRDLQTALGVRPASAEILMSRKQHTRKP